MNIQQLLIDSDTGEVLSSENLKNNNNRVLKKAIIDKMLEEVSNGKKDLDNNLLYSWCKAIKEINTYGQIKLIGAFEDKAMKKKMLEDITITGYTMRVIDKAHPFSCFLKKNHQSFITSWSQLWEIIDCKDSKTRRKIKDFLVSNDIVRELKINDKNGELMSRLVLNPFLFRGASYSSQIAIMIFQDFIQESVNMNTYPFKWLQAMGYINK